MWNDTDIPLAYLITFRSYGTWLHGDKRGSVDRFHNQYKSPYLPPDGERHKHTLSQLSSEVVTLTVKQRELVEQAIRETCEFRKWVLLAINVRTNHVHLVVSIGIPKPGRALNDFKAYATRKMRQNDCWHSEKSPWADKGSKRGLWNERSIEIAVDYVMNRQGDDLPDFD
jgi:REP element-mobilizing transposase RayT